MKYFKLLFFYVFSLAMATQLFVWGVNLLDQSSPLLMLLGLILCFGSTVFVWLWLVHITDDFLSFLKKFKD